jgi:hypothetical protein
MLIYLGCKALGMNEFLQVQNERRELIFPNDFPISVAFSTYSKGIVKEYY